MIINSKPIGFPVINQNIEILGLVNNQSILKEITKHRS